MSEEVVNEEVSTEEVSSEQVSGEVQPQEESSFVDSMLSQIEDEDLKNAGFFKNLQGKSASEFAQYVKELNSFAGKKGDIPKEDASDEEWNEFYNKLGRPESPEAYGFTINDEFADLVGEEAKPFFENLVAGFQEKAFEVGASADAAEEIIDWYLEGIAQKQRENLEAEEAYQKEAELKLQKEWGDGADNIANSIAGMLSANGMSEEDISNMSFLMKDPSIAIPLGKIASKFSDDPEIGHHMTNTMQGVRDQLRDIEMQMSEYISTGKKIPPHMHEQREQLSKKLGDDL